jgi:hypothetical protein
MPIEYHARAVNGVLHPASEADAEIAAGIPPDKPVKVRVTVHPRSSPHHRWFFGLVGLVAEHAEITTDQALFVIKLGIGHTVPVLNPGTGEILHYPRSVAWHKMDQTAFADFAQRAVDYVCRDLLPGIDSADLEREVNNRVGVDMRGRELR